MSQRPTRITIIAAIVAKDLRAFARDRLWLVLTPISILTAAAVFWLAPSTVDDTLWLGIYPPQSIELMEFLQAEGSEEGVVLVPFAQPERLAAAVAGRLKDASAQEAEVLVGLAFPADFASDLLAGGQPEVTFYTNDALPQIIRDAFATEVREMAYAMQAGLRGEDPQAILPVELPAAEALILGEDRAGALISMRDKLRPMLAIMILMLGSIAIAGLVAVEIEQGTVKALLATPARSADVLAAKGLVGTLLGSGQVLAYMLLTWSFGPNWWLVAALLLLGAGMMSAMGMLAGAAGKDFITTMFLAIVLIVPLAIPTFSVLFPGSPALWVQAMPSYGFVAALMGLICDGRDLVEVLPQVASTLAWTGALFALALFGLRRRLEVA